MFDITAMYFMSKQLENNLNACLHFEGMTHLLLLEVLWYIHVSSLQMMHLQMMQVMLLGLTRQVGNAD